MMENNMPNKFSERFDIKCKKSSDTFGFEKGIIYKCSTNDFLTFCIKTEKNTTFIPPDILNEYFIADIKITELPFGINFLSEDLKEKLFRQLLSDKMRIDVLAYTAGKFHFTKDDVDMIARRSANEYDGTLTYKQSVLEGIRKFVCSKQYQKRFFKKGNNNNE